MKRILCLVMLAAMAASPAAAAEFYRYVDAGGHVRFTDDINQVPESQRARARSYAGAQSRPADSPDVAGPAGGTPVAGPAAPEENAPEGDSIEATRQRLEEMKSEVEKDYQSLASEKDLLAKEKDVQKNREEIAAYNKRIEAFNQRAELYEKKSGELRKLVDDFNARVIEENAKSPKPKQN